MSNIGIHVYERDAGDAPPIVPASLTDTGMMIESERGLVNKAVKVTSAAQARERYGALRPATDFGAIVLKELFRNLRTHSINLYVSRVIGANKVVATTGNLTAGSTKLVARTSGSGGDTIGVTIEAGTISGKKVTVVDDTGAPVVTEVFDDVPLADFATAINSGVSGINSGNPSTLVRVSVLGSSLPDNIAQTNLAGGGTGVYSSYNFPGTTTTATVIKAGQNGIEDPGAWGNKLTVTVAASANLPNLRDVTVYLEDANGEVQQVEEWLQLSLTTFNSVINHSGTGSVYIYVATMGQLPDEVTSQTFTTGADGDATVNSGYTGDQASGTGVYAFDTADIQLITCSDNNAKEIAQALENYAVLRGTVTAVACTPYNTSLSTLDSDWKDFLMKSKSYLAVYRGWIEVDDGSGGTVFIPNIGQVIGAAYIRTMLDNGGLPHIAPAGDDTVIDGAQDVEYPSYNDADLNTLVKTIGINPVMYKSGAGFVVRTSRTYSSLSKWYSVHVRRSTNYLKASYIQNLGWLEQKGNNDESRRKARRTLRFFLQPLYAQGMFETSGGFDNNLSVKCDLDNNPKSVRDAKKLVIDNKVRFVEIIESIEINLMNTRDGILVEDS